MGMAIVSFLVVIGQFNVKSVGACKTKNNAPVGPHRYGPQTLQFAFERMQAKAGKIQSLRRGSSVESRENSFHRIQQVGANPASVTAFIEPFEAAIMKAPNHYATL